MSHINNILDMLRSSSNNIDKLLEIKKRIFELQKSVIKAKKIKIIQFLHQYYF